MFLNNRKRINLTIEEKWTVYFIIFDSENWKKNPPSQFCYFFRARKQRNKNEKRNKNEWVVTKMGKEGFNSFLLRYGIFLVFKV